MIRSKVWLIWLILKSGKITEYLLIEVMGVMHREQYAKLKMECRAMDDMIGSGQIATAPRINEDGTPVEEYHGGEISGADENRSFRNGTKLFINLLSSKSTRI